MGLRRIYKRDVGCRSGQEGPIGEALLRELLQDLRVSFLLLL